LAEAALPSSLAPSAARFYSCGCGEFYGSFYSLEMPFVGCLLFLNKRISTNIYGHFELFNFSSKLITLVAGLARE